MFVDTHAHINFREYKEEIPEVIKRAKLASVGAIINVGSNFETSKKTIEIIDRDTNIRIHANNTNNTNKLKSYDLQPDIYASIGCHPIHLVKDIVEEATFDGKVYKFKTKQEIFDYDKYKKLVQSSDKVVAIGETGLDYFRINENNLELKDQNSEFKAVTQNLQVDEIKQIQKKVFEEHIKLAQEFSLPLILHCRGSENNLYDAYDEMLEILQKLYNSSNKNIDAQLDASLREGSASWRTTKQSNLDCHSSSFAMTEKNRFSSSENDKLRGVIHCFGGSLVQAKEFIKLGFYLGFTGIVTFKNAVEIQQVVRQIPLEKILIETDCPFLAPVPYRGKRNEPAYVVEVAKKIAELKNISVDEVESVTTNNAINLFKI